MQECDSTSNEDNLGVPVECMSLSKEAIVTLVEGYGTDDEEPICRKKRPNQDLIGLPKLSKTAIYDATIATVLIPSKTSGDQERRCPKTLVKSEACQRERSGICS